MSRRRSWIAAGGLASVGTTLALAVGLSAGTGAAAVAVAPQNSSPPTITGTPQEGKKLIGHRGTWSSGVTDYQDRFQRCDENGGSCANISGATDGAAGYVLKKVDVGNTIRFRVTATNADGSTTATSVPTAVIKAADTPAPAPTPPAANGCGKASNGSIPIAQVSSPARLLVDQAQVSPSTITFGTTSVTARFHVTACGAAVQGALIYVTAVPYNQFSIPNEQPTGSDGWATLQMNKLGGFPATPKQQLLVMFVRARKSGEPTLAGISSRRLVSFRVTR
jgi:hypothetical protein